MFSWNVGKPPGLPQFHFRSRGCPISPWWVRSYSLAIWPLDSWRYVGLELAVRFPWSLRYLLNIRRQLIAKRLLNIKAVLSCRKRGEQWNRSYYVEKLKWIQMVTSRFFVLYKIFFSCQLYRTKDIFSKGYITLHRKVSFILSKVWAVAMVTGLLKNKA